QERGLNQFVAGDTEHLGIIMLGGMTNNVMRALKLLGQADLFGGSRVPLYILNVAYPLVEDEVLRFCRGKRAVLMVEEGQPDYLEQNLNTILRRHGVDTAVHGKDLLPMGGDYTVAALRKGLEGFLRQHHPAAFAAPVSVTMPARRAAAASTGEAPAAVPAAGNGQLTANEQITPMGQAAESSQAAAAALTALLPPRPPGLCVGCPERPIFSSFKLAERELGTHHVSADIGCHLFSIMPPFNLGATTMGYGLGASSASAFNAGPQLGANKRAVAFMGDGGFWHNGLTSGIANAVFNKQDNVFVIVDNNYSAATGGQDIPSSRAVNPNRSTMHAIERAVRGVGVEWVRTITRTYDVRAMRDALREALTTKTPGPKVVIAQSECMLNRQRREKPQKAKAIKAGERVISERFGVDAAVCSGDHACMRISGCPSLTLAPSGDALKPDPVAHVDEHCVACGHCGEVADAAVLCPSFYKVQKVNNAGGFERWRARWRFRLLGWLQGRQLRAREQRALYATEASR
ncbi:MAG: thiamine pyrophosphate-dependent enzyme, partial [Burkholderiaceae bacterium]